MNLYVADPHWHHEIVWYFFLGGIAAGSFAVARLVDLFGTTDDRRAVRVADYLAFPLVNICGILLIIDLNRPERFWHMLIQSETWRPMFKWWSPMSVGAWGLLVFGLFSAVTFLAALADDGWLGRSQSVRPRWSDRLSRGVWGYGFTLAGLASAFFLGSYTGALLTATNQPVWADSTWIAPLFLASAVSTGLATMVLLIRWRLPQTPSAVIERLEWTDTWAIGLEAILLVALAVSLGAWAWPAFGSRPGWLIPVVVVPAGLIVPVVVRFATGLQGAVPAAALVLIGGFALRVAVVGMPEPFRLIH